MILVALTNTEWIAVAGGLLILVGNLLIMLYNLFSKNINSDNKHQDREIKEIKKILTASQVTEKTQIEINTRMLDFMKIYKEDRADGKKDREIYQRSIGVQSGRVDKMVDQIQEVKSIVSNKIAQFEIVVTKTVDDITESKLRLDKAEGIYQKIQSEKTG